MRDKETSQTKSQDPDTGQFDPYRFGRIGFTTSFFKKLVTTSLPEPNEEDMLDSIPPGEGPTAEEARQVAARLKARELGDDPNATQAKRLFFSTEELRALGGDPRKRKTLLLFVLLGMVVSGLVVVWWNPPGEPEEAARPPTTNESAASKGATAWAVTAPGASNELHAKSEDENSLKPADSRVDSSPSARDGEGHQDGPRLRPAGEVTKGTAPAHSALRLSGSKSAPWNQETGPKDTVESAEVPQKVGEAAADVGPTTDSAEAESPFEPR